MQQEAKDLQQRAVSELMLKASGKKKELTFRAPTGSGKTRMMADFMNRMLAKDTGIVFLVSSLSKGNLASQNYEVFKEGSETAVFPNINPHLISTDLSGEEGLFIPTDHNVYVLPRDLFKKNGKLMQGPMINFLRTMTEKFFDKGQNKRIWLIKDECHQATNNLDTLSSDFFERIFNFSATPKLKRGQIPDIQITDYEAVRAKLIKRVEYGNENDTVEDAIIKFKEIKEQYISLGVNPCLIIQISNKDKAEDEWTNRIRPILEKVEHQNLKWMLIVDKSNKCDTNDAIKKKLPVDKWKDYAKRSTSTIDIIIFKMVISEGWDIPRACMLYQVRDTQSKQLDEQVMGRVRRNPRLTDFELLSKSEKRLATTAWIWGIRPESAKGFHEVNLWKDGKGITDGIKIKTTRLENLSGKKNFDLEKYIGSQNADIVHKSIFELHRKLTDSDSELETICYKYAAEDVGKWLRFMARFDEIKKRYNTFICNYSESMVVDKEVSFPVSSSYSDNGNLLEIENWVWCKDKGYTYSFDSEAERQWASILQKLATRFGAEIEYDEEIDDDRFLWGKNFPYNSDIKYEYYANGIHSSYPDFIMKDKNGIIHVFEVKSVNKSGSVSINTEEYEEKVRKLEECYRACSLKLHGIWFYLPVLTSDEWQITRFIDGEKDTIDITELRKSMK